MVNKIHRQIARYKGKRRDRERGVEELPLYDEFYDESEEEDELSRRIVRTKRFDMVPMDEVEAVEQMELLGHDFFVFYNVNDDGVNVLYRRRDGDYGLIQPV
jgi:putative sigma-54 modulation protein